MVAVGCAPIHTRNTDVCSVSFGLDNGDSLVPTNRIPHRIGVHYAWRLVIHSTKSNVRVKEIFKAPGSAPWGGNTWTPDGMKIISDKHSQSGNIHVEEFDLEIGLTSPQETVFVQSYEVVDGDPRGTHRISIFVDGKLIKKLTFVVMGE